jgi:hypothetical protein
MSQVQCGEIEVEKNIDEMIEQFSNWIEKHPNKKSQVYTDNKCLISISLTVNHIFHTLLKQGLNVSAAYRVV